MSQNRTFAIIGLLISFLIFSGCSNNDPTDGDWPAIRLTVNGKEYKKSSYTVPTEGGEFRIFSKNYGTLWLNEARENGNVVWSEGQDWLNLRKMHFSGEWYKVQYDNNENIAVRILPMEKPATSRSLYFSLQCGDAFCTITLIQE